MAWMKFVHIKPSIHRGRNIDVNIFDWAQVNTTTLYLVAAVIILSITLMFIGNNNSFIIQQGQLRFISSSSKTDNSSRLDTSSTPNRDEPRTRELRVQSRRGRVREKKASSPYRPRVYCFDSSQISNIISSLDKDTVDCKNFKGLNSSVGSIRRLVGNDSEVIYDLDKPDDIPSDILEALVCDNRAFCSHNHSLIAVVGNKVVVKNSARDSRPGLSDDQESNMSITSTVGIQNEDGENGDDASQTNPFEDESERQNQTNADSMLKTSAEEIEVENEDGLDGERLLEPATSSEGSIPQVLPGPSTSVPKGDVTSELSSVSRLSAKLSMQGSKLELQQTSKEYIKITDSLPRKASTGPNSILTNQDSYDNFSRRDWPNTMSIDDVKDLSSDSTDSELFGDWKGSTVDYNCPYCAVTTPHDHSDRCEMYFNVDMSSLQSSSSLYHTPQVNDDNSDNDSDQWHYSFTEHSTYKISERAETGNYNLSNMCGESSSVDLLAISPHGQQTNGHPENTTNELEQEVSLAEISRSLRFYGNVTCAEVVTTWIIRRMMHM